ncbi:hypothetical protein [Rhizobium leguminosarum]|uniref:hypothetical protein n=1 Tax=Rhizobium leguminosarum TaxID=384 RepID=UPI003F991F81
MPKIQLPKPINETQRLFAGLCEKGGGPGGGPARTKVQELLKQSGQALNVFAFSEMAQALKENPNANPWHICFSVGLCWGHLAVLEPEFIKQAANYLETGSLASLNVAGKFHYERGPEPIMLSLRGGRALFSAVLLPTTLSATIKELHRAQERWLTPILSPNRPPYIGSWNATAMFMTALFAQPVLASTLVTHDIMLPPGGPIFNALSILHKTNILSKAPDGSELDDAKFEPGSIYANTGLMAELLPGSSGWSLIDVHSGLYMLGTRWAQSDSVF